MAQYIDKDTLIAEIKKEIKDIYAGREYVGIPSWEENEIYGLERAIEILNTLEVIDPYEQRVQYDSIKGGIQAQAETYSFNIESELYNQQTTKEGQKLWRKEIEEAYIRGGEVGVELARDPRYKENLEVKEVDLEKECSKYFEDNNDLCVHDEYIKFAKHFYELGVNKAQKGE